MQPPNGFLTSEAAEAEAMLTPRVKVEMATSSSSQSGLNGSNTRQKEAIATASEATPRPRRHFKVTQCLVLLVVLALVAIICSVFLKPDIYFPEYGK